MIIVAFGFQQNSSRECIYQNYIQHRAHIQWIDVMECNKLKWLIPIIMIISCFISLWKMLNIFLFSVSDIILSKLCKVHISQIKWFLAKTQFQCKIVISVQKFSLYESEISYTQINPKKQKKKQQNETARMQ